jgi:hypothetical protein
LKESYCNNNLLKIIIIVITYINVKPWLPWLGFGFKNSKPSPSQLQAMTFGLAWPWLFWPSLAWLLA